MIQFDYPWIWLLLPLPWLAYRWLPAFREQRKRLRVPFTRFFIDRIERPSHEALAGQPFLSLLLRWGIWVLLLAAAARPITLEPPISHLEPKRSIVLAIDLSESMSEKDVRYPGKPPIERLAAVKATVANFIEKRSADRIGLVGFGDNAFPLAPPSTDHNTLTRLLSNLESGMAGANTALGDAIGVTLRLLETSQMPEKMLILLTDGNDNRSLLDPLQAARIANNKKLRIHVIGFGQPGDVKVNGVNGVNTETLEQIASLSGGQSFFTSDQTTLDQVYSTIDGMTPQNAEVLQAQPRSELFWMPVVIACGLVMLQLLTGVTGLRALNASTQSEEGEHQNV